MFRGVDGEISGMIRDTHHERILHTDDVTAQHGGLDLGHTDALALPGVAHARDDVVAADGGELLAEDLGAAIGLVDLFGHDGGLWHHDAGAGVLKLGVDADLLALAVATPVNLGVQRHLAVWDEHAGDLLLLHAASGGLPREEGEENGYFHMNSQLFSTLSHICSQ